MEDFPSYKPPCIVDCPISSHMFLYVQLCSYIFPYVFPILSIYFPILKRSVSRWPAFEPTVVFPPGVAKVGELPREGLVGPGIGTIHWKSMVMNG